MMSHQKNPQGKMPKHVRTTHMTSFERRSTSNISNDDYLDMHVNHIQTVHAVDERIYRNASVFIYLRWIFTHIFVDCPFKFSQYKCCEKIIFLHKHALKPHKQEIEFPPLRLHNVPQDTIIVRSWIFSAPVIELGQVKLEYDWDTL